MDRNERFENPLIALRTAMDGRQAEIWTALPAVVESYDPVKRTVTAQPAIQAKVSNETGATTDVTLPLCPDVPVLFPGGGGFVLTFPIAAGSEGLLVFASRCIDAFWQSGGVQPQAERRMHDLSDALFIPAPISQTQEIPDVSADNVQLRSNDGETSIEIAAGGICNIKATTVNVIGNLVVTGTIEWPQGVFGGAGGAIQGNITATGEITAGEGAGSVGLKTHLHAGVTAGGASTAPPTGGT